MVHRSRKAEKKVRMMFLLVIMQEDRSRRWNYNLNVKTKQK